MENNQHWSMPQLPDFTNPLDPKFDMARYFTQIQTIDCKPPTPAVPTQSSIAFAQWVINQGIKHPSCEYTHLFYTKEGFPYQGVIATHDIHQYETIIEMPYDSLITTQKAYLEYKHIFDSHPDLFCNVPTCLALNKHILILITYILAEMGKKEKSSIYPVLINNPHTFDTLLTWSNDELQELQNPYLLKEVTDTQLIIDNYYAKYCEVISKYSMFSHELITKEKFYWCLEYILSRCYFTGTLILAPYIYCLNHSDTDVGITVHEKTDSLFAPLHGLISKNVSEYYINDYDSLHPYNWIHEIIKNGAANQKPFTLYSNTSSFKKGEQVFNHYDDNNNESLLFFYGYCNEFNVYDYVNLPVDQIISQPNKVAVLLKHFKQDIPDNLENLSIPIYYSVISNTLINYSKLLLSKGDEFSLSKLNITDEVQAVENAIIILTSYLSKFPTTFKQDLELLKAKSNPFKRFMSIVYRAWQKRICHHQIFLLTIIKEMLTKVGNGESKEAVFKQAMAVENGMDEFSMKLSRKMILPYYELLLK